MKTLVISLVNILLFLLVLSCNPENEKFFDGESALHFEWDDSQTDTLKYSFMNVTEKQIVVHLPVQLEGYATSYDRSFRVEVDKTISTAVEGVHYQKLEDHYILEKGTYSKDVPVTLLYKSSLDSVAVKLSLTLFPSDEFSDGIGYRQKITIISSNLLPYINPEYWKYYYLTYFGTYSKVKHRYILKELDFDEGLKFEDVVAWRGVDYNVKKAYGQTMSNFFAENEIYDEYNQRILPW